MRRLLPFIALAALSLNLGCDALSNQVGTSQRSPEKRQTQGFTAPTRRFVLVEHNMNVAFDTQTGQLCRTWDWTPFNPPQKASPTTGVTPQQAAGQFSPTCLSLYQKFPTRSEPVESTKSGSNAVN